MLARAKNGRQSSIATLRKDFIFKAVPWRSTLFAVYVFLGGLSRLRKVGLSKFSVNGTRSGIICLGRILCACEQSYGLHNAPEAYLCFPSNHVGTLGYSFESGLIIGAYAAIRVVLGVVANAKV
jgi:hypothetical protein